MTHVDLLVVHATQLVTCASNGQPKRGAAMADVGIIENGAVAVHAGKIVAVGTTADLRIAYKPDNVVDASGKTVCPGFIDCHTHTVYGGNRYHEFEMRIGGRTYMEIMAAGGGINSTTRATRAATQDELVQQATKRLNTMLQLGTTTAEIKTGYGLDTATESTMLAAIITLARQHQMTIVPTFLGAHAVPPEFNDAASYMGMVQQDMLPAIAQQYASSHLAPHQPLYIDVFCEKGVFGVAQSRTLLSMGNTQFNMPIKIHVDEFFDLGGVDMALELGAVSVDHLDVTPADTLGRLAKSDTVGVMLPAVNFNLGSTHFGNARHLIDNGGILALSTDLNPGSAPTPSLPMIMAIACRYQKLLPAEALNAITVNAAAALQLESRIGSIEAGKQADLIILNTSDYRAVAYEFGANFTEAVIIEGEMVWKRSS